MEGNCSVDEVNIAGNVLVTVVDSGGSVGLVVALVVVVATVVDIVVLCVVEVGVVASAVEGGSSSSIGLLVSFPSAVTTRGVGKLTVAFSSAPTSRTSRFVLVVLLSSSSKWSCAKVIVAKLKVAMFASRHEQATSVRHTIWCRVQQ